MVEAQEKTAPTVPKVIHLMADAAPAIRNGMGAAVKKRAGGGGSGAPKRTKRRRGKAGDLTRLNNDDDDQTSAGLTETSSTASGLFSDGGAGGGSSDEDGNEDEDEFDTVFGDYDDERATKSSMLDADLAPLANIECVRESLDTEGEVLVSLFGHSSDF